MNIPISEKVSEDVSSEIKESHIIRDSLMAFKEHLIKSTLKLSVIILMFSMVIGFANIILYYIILSDDDIKDETNIELIENEDK